MERIRSYEEAVDARRAAEAANRAKSQFLAMMSYELRTPLNAIGGYEATSSLVHVRVADTGIGIPAANVIRRRSLELDEFTHLTARGAVR